MEHSQAKGIGAPVRRIEDLRLLTGRGQYSDDANLPGQAYAAFVRSPHAHALVRTIDAAEALEVPGCIAVLTGVEYREEGLQSLLARGNPTDVELKNHDGRPIFYTPYTAIVTDKVRRVGEIVAVVIAADRAAALDAAERVDVTYDELPAVVDPVAALAPGAPQLWDEAPGNVCVHDVKGDAAAVDAAFTKAARVVRLETVNNRVTGVPMEPRAAVANFDEATGVFTLMAGGQGVHRFQRELSLVFDQPLENFRIVTRDVGGGYGTRNSLYPEFALMCWAARRFGRPMKWTCTRSEAFLSDYAGRALVTRAELALDEKGRFLAMRTENIGDLGSHSLSFVPIARGPTVTTNVYDIPAAYVVTKGVFTNSLPVTAYRGAGRPEAIFVMERLVDLAADTMGIDRIELRRRNLVGEERMPYRNALGVVYDCGRFPYGMQYAMEIADWDGYPARAQASRAKGLCRGIGLANFIETSTGWPVERAEMTVLPDDRVDIVLGTQASGQGHETSFAQIVETLLGVPFDSVVLRTGDTDFVKAGSGSHSTRTMRVGGHLLRQTTDEIVEKGKRIAAELLEAATADIGFADGRFTVSGTDRSVGLFDVARAAERGAGGAGSKLPDELRGPLRAVADIDKPMPAYPNGCHIAEVEVEPDTGRVHLVAYSGVEDVGRVINPLLVEGQTHGAIAQGVGQALGELCAYDQESGQVLAGSFMDYFMPRADDMPSFVLGHNEVPTKTNLLGAKGAGEGGSTAAPAAIVNAIVDALKDYGVRHVEMPATAEKVWRAMKEGARGRE